MSQAEVEMEKAKLAKLFNENGITETTAGLLADQGFVSMDAMQVLSIDDISALKIKQPAQRKLRRPPRMQNRAQVANNCHTHASYTTWTGHASTDRPADLSTTARHAKAPTPQVNIPVNMVNSRFAPRYRTHVTRL